MNLKLTPAGEGNWLGLRGLKHPRAFQGVSFIDSQTYPEDTAYVATTRQIW